MQSRRSRPKTKLRRGDVAIVISGKEKGKRGKILDINLEKGTVVLESVRMRKKFVRPSQEAPKGAVIRIERPIHISNVQYYDDKAKKGARIFYQTDPGSKRKMRCIKSKGDKIRPIDRK